MHGSARVNRSLLAATPRWNSRVTTHDDFQESVFFCRVHLALFFAAVAAEVPRPVIWAEEHLAARQGRQ